MRRDQLNYQIEKNLPRETFSSNYQTINTFLTIVLALFAIIGFLGTRDIGAIRKEYLAELDKLNRLSKDLETNISKYNREIQKLKDDYVKVIQTTEKQDSRLRVLELLEKSQSLRRVGNYRAALEAVSSALENDPNNVNLLYEKGMNLCKLDDYATAMQTFERMLELDPYNVGAVENLLELYLLNGRLEDYTNMRKAKASLLQAGQSAKEDALYFDILESYQTGTYEQLNARVEAYAEFSSVRRGKTDWDFTDAERAINDRPRDHKKELLMLFFDRATRKIDIKTGRRMHGMSAVKQPRQQRKLIATNERRTGARTLHRRS